VEVDRAVAEAIAPLEPGYGSLLTRLASALERDQRVRALWLAGSVGRGAADAGSDLDVVVTVTSVQDFADPSSWSVLDPVITTAIPGMPGCFAFTTGEALRVDVVLETSTDLADTSYGCRIRIFDRDGLALPDATYAERGPDLDRMQAIVVEVLRQAAIFPAAVVAREDWLLGQQAVHNYGLLLYQLLVESNAPLPPMGVKQWTSRLTEAQRRLLTELVPPRPTRRGDLGDAGNAHGHLHPWARGA
jgi:Nucleotidyltransferase domain